MGVKRLKNRVQSIQLPTYSLLLADVPAASFLFKKIFKNVYFIFERERQSMSRGGAERRVDTESEAGSRL